MFAGLDRARDAAALAWFAQGSAFAGPGSGQDALWALYRAYHDGAAASRRNVDKTLCAALLADLGVEYSRKRLLGRPVRNCLLLGDNAGNRVAADFLDLLEECRRTSAHKGEPADPLLVVAVRRTQPPDVFGEPVDCTDEGLDITAARGWWYPVRLTHLGPDNVVDLLSPTAVRMLGSVRHDADFVYALTGGHPGATRQVVRLLAQRAADRDLGPRALLESTAPADDDRSQNPPTQTVEDSLIERLLAADPEMPCAACFTMRRPPTREPTGRTAAC